MICGFGEHDADSAAGRAPGVDIGTIDICALLDREKIHFQEGGGTTTAHERTARERAAAARARFSTTKVQRRRRGRATCAA
mmetsp:Transcript_7073/g.21131  ORF Transcript_7073/g.21131 Transcript_7073/m.21131 type:complete len:81 (-) Transcript_7073:142-384(-)